MKAQEGPTFYMSWKILSKFLSATVRGFAYNRHLPESGVLYTLFPRRGEAPGHILRNLPVSLPLYHLLLIGVLTA